MCVAVHARARCSAGGREGGRAGGREGGGGVDMPAVKSAEMDATAADRRRGEEGATLSTPPPPLPASVREVVPLRGDETHRPEISLSEFIAPSGRG